MGKSGRSSKMLTSAENFLGSFFNTTILHATTLHHAHRNYVVQRRTGHRQACCAREVAPAEGRTAASDGGRGRGEPARGRATGAGGGAKEARGSCGRRGGEEEGGRGRAES